MYHIKVLASLDDRLDAEFYNPAALRTIQRMEDVGEVVTLGSLIQEGYRVVYHGTDSINGLKQDQLLPFLSPTQIDKDGAISFEIAEQLPKYYKDEYPKGLAKEGELLVEVKGNVSKVAVVPSVFPKNLMISGSLYKASINQKKADTHYVLAFLKSASGQVLKDRLTSNTIINYIAKDALYSIPVFKVSIPAQKYIGEKVRQAERLRDWAKQLKAGVNSVLDDLALPIHAKPDMFSYAKKSILGDRLDPRPYRSNVVDLVDSIESLDHDKISTLVTFSSGCPVSSNDFVEENFAIPLVRIRNIAEEGFKGLDTGITQHTYDEAANYHAKEGMIVLGMDGYFKAQFCIPEELPMLINQRVAMLAVNGIRAELLTHWLNRPEGQLQLNQWAVKTTVEHTSLTDLAKVLIPRLNDSLEDELANKLSNARYSIRLSNKLTNLAKHLVEDLIEGQLTELQLVSAQQALEAGDDSLDRALLERMTAEGIDGEGDPLFDDLDQLYDLLDQAKQALDTDDTMVEA